MFEPTVIYVFWPVAAGAILGLFAFSWLAAISEPEDGDEDENDILTERIAALSKTVADLGVDVQSLQLTVETANRDAAARHTDLEALIVGTSPAAAHDDDDDDSGFFDFEPEDGAILYGELPKVNPEAVDTEDITIRNGKPPEVP